MSIRNRFLLVAPVAVAVVAAALLPLHVSAGASASDAGPSTGASLGVRVEAGPAAVPQALASSYVRYDVDTTHTESADGKARVTGGVTWYHGRFPRGYIHRGDVYPGTKVAAVARVGCVWARISWGYPTGSVSYPPGASVSGAAEVGKFFRSCRRAGQARPAPVVLTGLSFTKALLNSATLTVCTSRNAAQGPRFCSNEKEIYGD